MHAGHHALHKIDTMPTNRRKKRDSQETLERQKRSRDQKNLQQQRFILKASHFIVLFTLFLSTVKYFLE